MSNIEPEKNSNIELLLGDHKRAIKQLAWPMMVSMFLIMAYNLADSIWVAGLGADALAAIGFTSPLFMIIIGIGTGIGAGANSLITRFIGADNYKQANNTAVHSLVLTVIISVLGAILMCVFLPNILIAMGAGSSLQMALDYGYIVFGLMIVFIYSQVATAILRSEGDVKREMYAIAVTAVLNIILDPIMIYVMGMGIKGAAYASVISSFISCLVLLYWIHYKKDTYMDVSFKNFHYERKIITGILNISIPSIVEDLIFSVISIFANWMLVVTSGTIAVASFTAALRLIELADIPLISVAAAAYGASKYEKVKNAYIYTLKLGLIMTTAMVVILFVFAPQFSMLFAYSSSVTLAPYITEIIRILTIFIYSLCLGAISAMLFQGVGKGITSLFITIIRAIVGEVILAYFFCMILGWGAYGVYIGITLGGLIGGFVSLGWAILYLKRLIKNYKADPDIVDENI